ncbi:MAG: ABC transporter ATP-binding protein [Proteobacteria bacterium]|nr:ABC transporter ATP-binding protein [Pseudomonadota bacterium]MCP4918953.1 ABC transporter ATP-binding protein [Pseudomonadota bacterium]
MSDLAQKTPDRKPILELKDLRTHFRMEDGIAKAVDGVNYEIFPGETLSVVGESGSGKSVTALSVMGLIPCPPGIEAGGEILFEGNDLRKATEAERRAIRGGQIAMIFQEPMTSLNPVYSVGEQIGEALRLHKGMNKREAWEYSVEMLDRVGIPKPRQRVDEYPHQMSGGMRQRVMIAMALSCDPRLLIADEPTTALDVTIQAQILDLMNKLQEDFGTSVLFITHDLGVVAEVSDHVAVMYAGKVVEYADVMTLYGAPQHPYTVGLFKSLPDIESDEQKLDVIPGVVPSPLEFPSGCRFRNRCAFANERCAAEEPLLRTVGTGHTVACHAVEEARL